MLELLIDLAQFMVECVVYAVQNDKAAQAKLDEIAHDLGIADEPQPPAAQPQGVKK